MALQHTLPHRRFREPSALPSCGYGAETLNQKLLGRLLYPYQIISLHNDQSAAPPWQPDLVAATGGLERSLVPLKCLLFVLGQKFVSSAGHGAAHQLCCLDLQLLAVQLNKATIVAEEFARLGVFGVVHEIELCFQESREQSCLEQARTITEKRVAHTVSCEFDGVSVPD